MSELIKLTDEIKDKLAWYGMYIRAGFYIAILEPRSKAPQRDYPGHGDTARDVEALINGGNLGLWMQDGFFALDFDTETAYQHWKDKNPYLARTATAKTPHGYHVIFYTDVKCPSGQSEAVTVVSEGWYIAVHPSIHPSGQVYEWIVSPVPVEWSVIKVREFDQVATGIDTRQIDWDVEDY